MIRAVISVAVAGLLLGLSGMVGAHASTNTGHDAFALAGDPSVEGDDLVAVVNSEPASPHDRRLVASGAADGKTCQVDRAEYEMPKGGRLFVNDPADGLAAKVKIANQSSGASAERFGAWPIVRRSVASESGTSAADPSPWGPEEALVRAFIDEAWNQGDFRNSSTQLSPVVTLHFGGRDIPLRVEDMITFANRFRNAFADFRWTVDEAVARGSTVAMRTTFSGTMTGSFDGHPPNGRSMKVSFQLFGHVRDGRICELWEEYDVAGMRRQLGIGP
jgi:steroid delta-isomerase-like uncharacterized protein